MLDENLYFFMFFSLLQNILTVLKRETVVIFKTRSEPLTYALACNILLIALQDSYEWPENIAKVQ